MICDISSGFKMVENGGLKKASLYDHFEGLTTDFFLVKQDTVGRGWIEKKAFLTLF